MASEKKFDLKALATMDLNDLFQKKSSVAKPKSIKVMTKPVISFDFGSSSIKVVEGRYVKQALKITQLFKIETPLGSIVDGKIIDANLVVNAIQPALEQYKVKAKDVICTINSTQIINRELFIPIVGDDEMETVVRFEIQKFLPVNLEDYLVQFIKLGEVEIDGTPKMRLNVITFPEKMAISYYDLMKDLGLKPYALDVSYNAVGKLAKTTNLQMSVTDEEGTVAFVDMGAHSIDLNIYNEGNIQFTRLIKSGGTVIDQALSQLPDMSIKSAVSLKESMADLSGECEIDEVQAIIQNEINNILTDLERILQFYRNKAVGNGIDHLFIFGGSANIKGLDTFIEQRLNIPTTFLKTLDQVELAPNQSKLDLSEFINAMGAIIRQ